jgi:hypothetical protein
MRKLVLGFAVLGLAAVLLPACAADVDEESVLEGDLEPIKGTPLRPTSVFDQGRVCANVLAARAGFRDVDLAEGVLRWNCGDVNGVTVPDLGQEYCEFHAVLNGRVVDRTVVRLGARDTVECLFTSVFADAKGAGTDAFEAELAPKIAPQLKNARSIDPKATVMQVDFNTRDAAKALVDDCEGMGRSGPTKDVERQAACVAAYLKAPASKRPALETACKGIDLSDELMWDRAEALGVAVDPDDEQQRELAACTMVRFAPQGGVGWRNSDPSICARTFRATRCGLQFKSIPDELLGFDLRGWTNRETLPVGCKYLTLDGAPSRNLVVCAASRADVDEYTRARKPLQMMCRDRFGTNLALQAPLRALTSRRANARSAELPAFCSAFGGRGIGVGKRTTP